MTDEGTIQAYMANAQGYAKDYARREPDEDLLAFMAAVPDGGRVLDLGCGPGNSAAMMADRGYEVEASDATQAMADLALENYGIKVRVEPFDALSAVDYYNGIWANFSLLHAPREDLPDHLARVATALREGGILHLGMKLGQGEARDSLGRFYTYYSQIELRSHVEAAGLSVTSERVGEGAGMAGHTEPFCIVLAHG